MLSLKNWQQGKRWRNWSESYSAYPIYYAPNSIDEIEHVVKEHVLTGNTIRVTGAAHSFSPVALPEHSALSMHNLRGLLQINSEAMEATFYAGTYLYEIGPLLAEHGLALYNMGDIDAQSLAGVVATGTHGTGRTLTSFSNMVVKWGIVNGLGQYIEYERGEDDISKALHISLGLLGIFVTITIKVRPLYSLHYRSERVSMAEVVATFDKTINEHRHVEWYYFPGSDILQKKTMDEVPLQRQSKWQAVRDKAELQIVENGLFYIASQLCHWRPSWSKHVSKLSSQLISTGEKTSVSYEVFPTPRHVKFHEVEYAIPLQSFTSCLQEVHALFAKEAINVHFPIECRVAAAETGFLSPSQGEEVAYIAFHQYKKQQPQVYFQHVDELMKRYDARAHWGKLNRYSTQTVSELFPQLSSFEYVRQQFDPHDVFMTGVMKKIMQKT